MPANWASAQLTWKGRRKWGNKYNETFSEKYTLNLMSEMGWGVSGKDGKSDGIGLRWLSCRRVWESTINIPHRSLSQMSFYLPFHIFSMLPSTLPSPPPPPSRHLNSQQTTDRVYILSAYELVYSSAAGEWQGEHYQDVIIFISDIIAVMFRLWFMQVCQWSGSSSSSSAAELVACPADDGYDTLHSGRQAMAVVRHEIEL